MERTTARPAKLGANSPAEDFCAVLLAEIPFHVSQSLWGLPGGSQSLGWLPDHYANAYTSARVSYTVYSYHTPIAWRLESGPWIMPAIRYGVTTGKKQSKIFGAIRMIGG